MATAASCRSGGRARDRAPATRRTRDRRASHGKAEPPAVRGRVGVGINDGAVEVRIGDEPASGRAPGHPPRVAAGADRGDTPETVTDPSASSPVPSSIVAARTGPGTAYGLLEHAGRARLASSVSAGESR
jgi:hypothetical protein